MSQTPERRESTNDWVARNPELRKYVESGMVLTLQRMGLTVVPLELRNPGRSWDCQVIVGNDVYPANGYRLAIGDDELRRAIGVPEATVKQASTLQAVRALHASNEHWGCGATSDGTVTITGLTALKDRPHTTTLQCTLDLGHDGGHEDSICCYSKHVFADAIDGPARDLRMCRCGSSYSRCATAAVLDGREPADTWGRWTGPTSGASNA